MDDGVQAKISQLGMENRQNKRRPEPQPESNSGKSYTESACGSDEQHHFQPWAGHAAPQVKFKVGTIQVPLWSDVPFPSYTGARQGDQSSASINHKPETQFSNARLKFFFDVAHLSQGIAK